MNDKNEYWQHPTLEGRPVLIGDRLEADHPDRSEGGPATIDFTVGSITWDSGSTLYPENGAGWTVAPTEDEADAAPYEWRVAECRRSEFDTSDALLDRLDQLRQPHDPFSDTYRDIGMAIARIRLAERRPSLDAARRAQLRSPAEDQEMQRLRDWQTSAMHELGKWDAVFDALGKPGPLGESKAANALAELVIRGVVEPGAVL